MRACRTCLSRHDLVALFNELQYSSDQLYLATGVKISPNDGLPQTVCKSCRKSITKTLHFREISLKVDTFFKSTATHITVKTEHNDFQSNDKIFESLTNPYPNLDDDTLIENNQSNHNYLVNEELNEEEIRNINYTDVNDEHNLDIIEENGVIEYITDFNNGNNISIDNTPVLYQQINTENMNPDYVSHSYNAKGKVKNYNNTKKPTNIHLIFQKLADLNKHNNSNLIINNNTDTSSVNNSNIRLDDHNYCTKSIKQKTADGKLCGEQQRSVLNSTTGILGHRKYYIRNLIKNLNERKTILITAQKMIEQRQLNQQTNLKLQKEIVQPKSIVSKQSQFDEKNKKLMELAVSGYRPNGSIQCRLCRKLSQNIGSFKRHAVTHFNPEFICQMCGQSFHQQHHLRRHQRSRGHGADKHLACPHCSFRAADRNCMRNHVRAHTGEKPYECNECGTKFRMRSNIVQHLVTHFGVKKFQCELCAARFKRKTELWKHQRSIHHNIVTTHYCYMCTKTYRHVKDARNHLEKVHGVPLHQQLKLRNVKAKRNEAVS